LQLLSWIESGEPLAVNAISVAEFYAGLRPEEAQEWEEFISALTYWQISLQAAKQAGQDHYTFARKGITITITDALMAAVAREHNAVLVTNNVKDYPMPDLTLRPLISEEKEDDKQKAA
jgi:predicted nucleic acid-binding protein